MKAKCIGDVIYPKGIEDGDYTISFDGTGLKLHVTIEDGKVMYSDNTTGPVEDIIQPGIEITTEEDKS